MKYFEQAALNGSSDGMFNLGIYHLSGKNPNSPFRNEVCLPHTSPHIYSVPNQVQSMSPYISFMIHRWPRSNSSWMHHDMVTLVRQWRWPGTFPQETLKACLRMWRERSCKWVSLTRWRWIILACCIFACGGGHLNSATVAHLTAEASIYIFKIWLCYCLWQRLSGLHCSSDR